MVKKILMLKNSKIIVMAAVIFLFLCVSPLDVYARAGGGDSGSSDSGSSSSSGNWGSSGSNDTYHNSGTEGTGNVGPVGFLIPVLAFVLLRKTDNLLLGIMAPIKSAKARRYMNSLAKEKDYWDYKQISDYIEKAYFEIQNCWKEGDADLAEEYLSRSLHQDFTSKLGWMQVRKEQAIQKNVRLLRTYPVAVHADIDDKNDYLWILIKGRMAGYYINTETEEVVKGDVRTKSFSEYWQFIRCDDRWVLNKIEQTQDISINELN